MQYPKTDRVPSWYIDGMLVLEKETCIVSLTSLHSSIRFHLSSFATHSLRRLMEQRRTFIYGSFMLQRFVF